MASVTLGMFIIWSILLVSCIKGRKLEEKNGGGVKKPEWFDSKPGWIVGGGGGLKGLSFGHSFSFGKGVGFSFGSGKPGFGIGKPDCIRIKRTNRFSVPIKQL